jgi:hypothetical protein
MKQAVLAVQVVVLADNLTLLVQQVLLVKVI